MNIKHVLLFALICTIGFANSVFSMQQQLTKTVEKALKNNIAKKFDFSKIVPESLDTLIAYNKNMRNNIITRLFLATPVAIIGGVLQAYTIKKYSDSGEYYVWRHYSVEERDRILLGSAVSIVTVPYIIKKGHSAYIRQYMLNNLQKIKNSTNNFFDQQYTKALIHRDIKNNLQKTHVVVAEEKTPAQSLFNINDNQTLAEVLVGEFNTPKCTVIVS